MQLVGRYQLLSEIARGGMGVVYRALDPSTQEEVALKVQLAAAYSNPVALKRFKREAEALAKVDHPHVVRLIDHDVTPQGQPYLVMELVAGQSLQQRLDREGRLEPEEAARIAVALCEAVAACHEAGVIHRDLKPDNVIVAPDGTLKLTDFGLVRDTDPSLSRTQLTQEGKLLGTPGYWAPEQARGKLAQVGPRTDVYGLGATLFALLTGEPPHRGSTLIEIVANALTAKPKPSELDPQVPAQLDLVVARALEVDPRDRYPNADAMRLALQATEPSTRWGAVLAAASVVILGVLGAGAVVVAGKASPSPAPTQVAAATPPEASPVVTLPPSAEAVYARGLEFAQVDREREAEQAFSEALRLRPDYAEAYEARGEVRLVLQDLEGAIEDLSALLRLRPDEASAYSNRGAARLQLGDTEGGLNDLSASLRLQPDNPTAYSNRATIRLLADDAQGGLEDANLAIQFDPEDADHYALRATARRMLGDLEGSIEDLGRAIRRHPDNRAELLKERASARMAAGELRAALNDANDAIEIDANYAAAYMERGIARGHLGDPEGLREDMDTVLRLEPNTTQALLNRGYARELLGDLEGAIEDAERVLALDPDGSSAVLARPNLARARQALAARQGNDE